MWRFGRTTGASRRCWANARRRIRVEGRAADRLTAPGAAEVALERIATQAVLAAVATLRRDQSEIIMLRVVAGLDTQRVAHIVGKSRAVPVAAHRGLRRLARLADQAGVTA